MKGIEIKVLTPELVTEAEKFMVATARLTQRGHKISSVSDFEALLNRPYTPDLVHDLSALPHPTIQKFMSINVIIVGLSRRALLQLRSHQTDVHFMSSSLQYSDYSGAATFTVPYEITVLDHEGEYSQMHKFKDWHQVQYLRSCAQAAREYEAAIKMGVPHDAAGYLLPMGLRGVLVFSATAYQLKHMISQRICLRNTLETQYIFLRIWEELYSLQTIFKDCGPMCTQPNMYMCPEGNLSCGQYPTYATPTDFLDDKFKYIRGK